jgi:ribosomal protein S18
MSDFKQYIQNLTNDVVGLFVQQRRQALAPIINRLEQRRAEFQQLFGVGSATNLVDREIAEVESFKQVVDQYVDLINQTLDQLDYSKNTNFLKIKFITEVKKLTLKDKTSTGILLQDRLLEKYNESFRSNT